MTSSTQEITGFTRASDPGLQASALRDLEVIDNPVRFTTLGACFTDELTLDRALGKQLDKDLGELNEAMWPERSAWRLLRMSKVFYFLYT